MKVYQQMPVSVSLLKVNGCAKTIKQLSKSDDESKLDWPPLVYTFTIDSGHLAENMWNTFAKSCF